MPIPSDLLKLIQAKPISGVRSRDLFEMVRDQFNQEEKEENIVYIFDHFLSAYVEDLTYPFDIYVVELFYEILVCPKKNIATLDFYEEAVRNEIKESFFDKDVSAVGVKLARISNDRFKIRLSENISDWMDCNKRGVCKGLSVQHAVHFLNHKESDFFETLSFLCKREYLSTPNKPVSKMVDITHAILASQKNQSDILKEADYLLTQGIYRRSLVLSIYEEDMIDVLSMLRESDPVIYMLESNSHAINFYFEDCSAIGKKCLVIFNSTLSTFQVRIYNRKDWARYLIKLISTVSEEIFPGKVLCRLSVMYKEKSQFKDFSGIFFEVPDLMVSKGGFLSEILPF